MTPMADSNVDRALKVFRKQRVITVAELAEALQASIVTARRRLKAWNTYTSYNRNGQYYVLSDVPEFDSCGLWRYRGIGFSRYGNLTHTVVELVYNAPAGLTGAELGQRLGLEPRSFLSHFHNHPAVKREKHQGCFVYFAADLSRYDEQKPRRLAMVSRARRPCDAEAVAILVATIQHPDLPLEGLCAHLKQQGLLVTPESVSSLFAEHGLAIKKTPRSAT